MKDRGVVVAMLPGQELGTSLVNRLSSERGNHPRSPPGAGSQPGPGQARRRPRAAGWAEVRSGPSAREACTWRRGPASQQGEDWNARSMSSVNTDELESALCWGERRVLGIQTKLHQWASGDPHRRFNDLVQARHRSPVPSGRVGSGAG